MSYKIFITRSIYKNGLDMLERHFGKENIESWEGDDHCPYEIMLQKSKEVDALVTHITDRVDEAVLSSERLKIVSQCAVGLDNIDLEAATKHNVVIAHTPEVLTDACADLAWALIMGVSRHIVASNKFVYSGDWKTFDQMQFLGFDVFGQTMGIIGAGRIGQAVARRALGFSMKLLYTGPHRKDVMDNYGATYVGLEELLRESDFVVITAPLNESTKGMIGTEQLNMMKRTGILVNISRGKIVKSYELAEALKNKTIAAAALDVFDPEPIPRDHPIMELDNVLLTSHIAGATITSRKRMASLTAHAVIDTFAHRKVHFLANKDVFPKYQL